MTIMSYILLGLCFINIIVLIAFVIRFRPKKTPIEKFRITPLGLFTLAENDFKETHNDNDDIVDYIYDSLETYVKDYDLMMFYDKERGSLLFYKVAYKGRAYSNKDSDK